MSAIQFPCAHCGGAVREPLTLAAKRHRRDPRAVLEAFRALERGGPSAEQIARAAERRPRGVGAAWRSRPSARPGSAARVARVEDEALLRGEGRFMDDLAAGAARLARGDRPLAARARPRSRSTRRPALELPACVGVLTGADVARLSRPFPAAIDSPVPQYAAAVDTARYVGEPLAVVVARDRYVAEDAAELVAVDYDPLEPVRRPASARRADPRPLVPLRRRRRGARARPTSSSATTFRVPRFTCTARRVLRRRLRLGRGGGPSDGVGELPGPVHAPRRRRGGARPARRPPPPADAARLGRLVRDQGGRAPVRRPDRARRRARSACPCAGPRTGSSTSPRARPRPGASTEVEAGFTRRRRARRAPLRRDRGRRRVRPRARAGDALPDARLALGRLPRARTSPRGTASCSRTRSRPGSTAASAGRSSTSGSSGRWRSPRAGSGSTRPSSRGATSCRPTRCRTARRRARSTTRATTRPASTRALELAGYDELRARASAARADGRLVGVGLACVVEPSISNMGYITLAQTAVERAPTLPEVGERRGRVGRDRPARRDHGAARDDTAGPGAPHGLRPGRRRRARLRARGRDRAVGAGHRDDAVDGRVRELLVALLRGRRRGGAGGGAEGAGEGRRDPRARRRPRARRCAGSRGWRTGIRKGCPDGMEPGLDGGRVLGDAEPRPARRRGSRRVVRRARVHRRRLRRRGRPRRRAR